MTKAEEIAAYGNLSLSTQAAHITGQHLHVTADTFTLIVHWNRKKQNENFGAANRKTLRCALHPGSPPIFSMGDRRQYQRHPDSALEKSFQPHKTFSPRVCLWLFSEAYFLAALPGGMADAAPRL